MILVFLYLLNVVLFTRALWVFCDEQVRPPFLLIGIVIQLLSLLLLQGLGVLFLGAGIVFVNLLTWFFEWRIVDQGVRLFARLLGLICWLVILGFLCSDLLNITFNRWTTETFHSTWAVSDILSLIGQSQLHIIFTCCAGVFLAVVEAHTAVRFLFQTFNVKPMRQQNDGSNEPTTVDQMEYNRGRVIGALERLVTFFFVLQGAYSALGFLIAAKGMTRFKQLDNRDFAEYFLIGTLLSIILAAFPALAIQCLLKVWQ